MNLSRLEWQGESFALLSEPSKMPGLSYGITAYVTCPGAKLAEKLANLTPGKSTVCSKCYARKGRYLFRNVRESLERRTAWTRQAVAYGTFAPVLTAEISRTCRDNPWFRIHHSGDFFSARYVECWVEVCKALPWVSFWAPTRSYMLPAMLPALQALAALPNVTVRPSATRVDDPPPVVPGLSAGTGVTSLKLRHTGMLPVCPAPLQGGVCGSCRVCWSDEREVNYHAH